MSRSFRRELAQGIKEDAFSEAVSRVAPFVPFSTFKLILRRFGLWPSQSRAGTFLSMSPPELMAFYSAQSEFLKLPWGDRMRTIPVVVAADWTTDPRLAAKVEVLRETSDFELDGRMESVTEPALMRYHAFLRERGRKPPRDDLNLRIAHWDTSGESEMVGLQGVRYFDSIRTNLTMDYKHAGRTLRAQVHPNHCLEPLGDSSLADHVGVETLLFSSEGHLVMGRRSRTLAVTGGQIGPVGAGALRSDDLPPGSGRLRLTQLNLLRELYAESGLDVQDIDPNSLHVLGIVRDLLRGGKPQLCLSVRSLRRVDEILEMLYSAETSYEHKHLIAADLGIGIGTVRGLPKDKIEDVRGMLGALLSTCGSDMTEPLLGALALWWRSLADDSS